MITELDHSKMYYRGLGNLTYNEVMERKYKNLKKTVVLMLGVSVIAFMMLMASVLFDFNSEVEEGFYYGFTVFFWFFMSLDIFSMFRTFHTLYNLRLKEIEG